MVGMLKTLGHNKGEALPLKLFEVSDVVFRYNKSPESAKERANVNHIGEKAISDVKLRTHQEVKAKNNRNVAIAYCNVTAVFEIIHGMLDYVMSVLKIPLASNNDQDVPITYSIRPSDDEAFFPGQRADVYLRRESKKKEKKVGVFGLVHPTVLERYQIPFPVVLLELRLQSCL